MRILKTLLIAMLFVNCATPIEPVYTYNVNKELQPYVKEVLKSLEFHDIEFKKQSFVVVFDADLIRTPIAGRALGMDNDDLVYVIINPLMWGKLTVKERRHVIFHELSHDIFNIEHTNLIELMRPSMPSPSESKYMRMNKQIYILMKYIKNGQS